MKKLFTLSLLTLLGLGNLLSQVGDIDPTFNIGTGANNSILSAYVQTDGKILAVGGYTLFNGQSKTRIIRLNSDGSIDNGYTTGAGFGGTVYRVKQLMSGKAFVTGQFTNYGVNTANRLARINTDGTKDATYATGTATAGANGFIYDFVEQPDAKIIVGGGFTSIVGTAKTRIARLNSNGTIDNTFSIGTGINNSIYKIALQSDSKVIVGGAFTTYNAISASRIVRINSNGAIDNTFTTGTGFSYTTPTLTAVYAIDIQSDGKIIVGGTFTSYNGSAVNNIVRLNSNGTIDNSFTISSCNSNVRMIKILTDGKILVAGSFTNFNGASKNRIVRLNSDGSNDNTFGGTGSNNDILDISFQSNNDFLISGAFTSYSGSSINRIARILNNCSTPTISVSQTSNTCNGGSSATASVSVTGGTAFTYTWLPQGSNSFSVSGLTAGDYTCIVSNACASSSSVVVTITDPAIVPVAISGGTATVCSGGEAILTASGALTYLWSNSSAVASTTVNPSSNTSYTVTGTDGNGCSNTAVKTVTVSGTCVTSSVPCGKTITNFASSFSAVSVTGAINYRFKFYNNTTNALVASKTQASRTLTFSSVSNIFYGNTYKWTVAVDKGSGFGAESSNSCTITFAIPTSSVVCGRSYSNLNTYNAITSISKATNYRFNFYDNVTNALLATKTQTSTYIYFNQVTGLQYGNTYKWTVAVEYNNGTTTLFGPESSINCTITFNAPSTKLPCGSTYTSTTAYSAATPVSYALAYRFNFYDNVTNALVSTKTNANSYVYFSQMPGLIFNKTYKWTVEVQYFNGTSNVFGPASSNTCTVTWGAFGSKVNNGDNSVEQNMLSTSNQRIDQSSLLIEDENNWLSVFPNPTNGLIKIEGSLEIINVEIKNVAGQLLINQKASEIDLTPFDNGFYFINVLTDNGYKNFKIIKE